MGETPANSGFQRQTFTAAERRVTLAGLMIVFLLSALDQTIVSTAMPRIVAQLQGLNLYAWVTTAYLLSSTVMVPIYGKLSDIYGRKPVLVVGISIFIVGSALCGMAGEFGAASLLGGGMVQLIVFRSIQGLGGAALFTSAFVIIADLYTPRERGRLGGLFGAMFGLASVLGPLAGGFFTDLAPAHLLGLTIAGWRWVFYVNLPLAGFALFIIIAKMPRLAHRAGGGVDFLGAGLLIATVVPLLLALSLAGRDLGWASPPILGLFAFAALGLLGFIWAEIKAPNPILTLSLFRNRTFSAANLAGFLSFMAFMGMVSFLPLYMQLGQGVSATVSGLTLLPLTVGVIVSAILCGFLATRTGQYLGSLIGGAVLVIIAAGMLTQVTAQTGTIDVAWRVFVLGLGFGPAQGLFNLAVQNAVPLNQIGIATSSGQFFRQIGSTVGVAIFGAILTHSLQTQAIRSPGASGAAARPISLADLERMAVSNKAATPTQPGAAIARRKPVDPVMRRTITSAIRKVIFGGVLIAFAALIATAFVPALPLRANAKVEPLGEAPGEAAVEPDAALLPST